jgi:hypothetical protein
MGNSDSCLGFNNIKQLLIKNKLSKTMSYISFLEKYPDEKLEVL